MKAPTVILIVEGGLVRNVLTDRNVRVIIVDYDNDEEDIVNEEYVAKYKSIDDLFGYEPLTDKEEVAYRELKALIDE